MTRQSKLCARARSIKLPSPKVLGARIMAARKACGWREPELAESIGRTQRWLWGVEHGEIEGRWSDVTRIGLMLGLPPEKLYL